MLQSLSLYRSFSLRPVSVHSGAGTRATVSFVSLGYFIVSPVIRFPRVRNHRGVSRYRWPRSSTERDKGVSGRAKRGRGRQSSEKTKRAMVSVLQAAGESNRNRVKCSRVKPCRGTTSITCGGFVTATFSATF